MRGRGGQGDKWGEKRGSREENGKRCGRCKEKLKRGSGGEEGWAFFPFMSAERKHTERGKLT